MVRAVVDDGQCLTALNEVFIGHPTHQSARYRIALDGGASERQSSSGVLAGTGTGASGWLRSCHQERRSPLPLTSGRDPEMLWFVREAWPSPATATGLTEGLLRADASLTITAESDRLVVFGDGMESDVLVVTYGQRVRVDRSPVPLRVLVPVPATVAGSGRPSVR